MVNRQGPPVSSAAGALMMCVGALVFAGAAAGTLETPPQAVPPLPALLSVAALGVFSTGLATVGYVFLIQRRGPLFMSMSIYLAPCLATGLGMVALGERPGLPAFVALAMILMGVGLASMAPRKAAEPAS